MPVGRSGRLAQRADVVWYLDLGITTMAIPFTSVFSIKNEQIARSARITFCSLTWKEFILQRFSDRVRHDYQM
jgi:hypothetical protein